MATHDPRTPADFPESVHRSLAALRQIARTARSRHDPALRWGTEDEIALSEALRKKWHCVGHSSRTGLACMKSRVLNTTVCVRHGASTPQVKAAAKQRLREMVNPVLARLHTLAMQSEHLPTAYNAARDLADRAGIGELVEAKVRSSGTDRDSRIVVNIGFLPGPTGPTQAIVVHRSTDALTTESASNQLLTDTDTVEEHQS